MVQDHFPLDPPGEERPGASDLGGPAALDPANKSLLDALRLSFRILQVVMILLVLVYMRTGYTIVPEQEKGLRLTFGKMNLGEPLEPGGHVSWPEPMGEFVIVRTASQELDLSNSFWLALNPNERALSFSELNRQPSQGLTPGEDGSVITADRSLAHARVRVSYRIADPRAYVENVYRPQTEKILRKAVERGVVFAASTSTLDELITQREHVTPVIKERAQELLDDMDSGIAIESVSLTEARPPRPVLDAYESVNSASAEARRIEQEARAERARLLNNVAGSSYKQLLPLIDEYESLIARRGEDPEAAQQAESLLESMDHILLNEAAGQVATTIGDAISERINLVTALQREAQQHAVLYAQYLENPELTVIELWTRATEVVMAKDFIRFWLGEDAFMVDLRLNRPAEVLKRREVEEARRRRRGEQ